MIATEALGWAGFIVFVLAMLALDLGVFHRKAHEVKMKEALIWTCVWVTLALLLNLGIYLGFVGGYTAPEARSQAALEYLTGYLIEVSLSIDNVFVFALLFSYFKVPPLYRHRVLFWGILGALVMRAFMIFAGVALLHRFHWLIYLFGALLVFAGFKMWRSHGVEIDPEHNPVLRFVRRIFSITSGEQGPAFFARVDGALAVTPLFVVLMLVEWTDLVFAIDSIPAVLAVTKDPFIVFTSNVMAILGLRSLYFALAGVMKKFHLLHYGLAAILAFVGAKMLLADIIELPVVVALGVVAAILATAIIASLVRPAPDKPVKRTAPDDALHPGSPAHRLSN
jgi:tellurite resistance protein TerC